MARFARLPATGRRTLGTRNRDTITLPESRSRGLCPRYKDQGRRDGCGANRSSGNMAACLVRGCE